jgi:putative tryptophan/tyrosine transport system substrate-binding protein
MPVIGFLNSGVASAVEIIEASFRQGLGEAGFVDGRNVTIENRIADGHVERLPDLTADLVQRRVDLISAGGGDLPARAAESLTRTIPIVFTVGSDPVGAGLVASFNRPGGNATGISMMLNELEPKRLEILHETIPAVTSIGLLLRGHADGSAIEAAARAMGLDTHIVRVDSVSDLDDAFAQFHEQKVGAVLVGNDPLLEGSRKLMLPLALRYSLPFMLNFPGTVEEGVFMSYGPDVKDVYRVAGTYAGRILKGEKPGDLPVQQPTKFVLAINLKIAKSLGITVPPTILIRADMVVE